MFCNINIIQMYILITNSKNLLFMFCQFILHTSTCKLISIQFLFNSFQINKANISTSLNKSNDEIVIVSESNGIRRVTLNNPRKRSKEI